LANTENKEETSWTLEVVAAQVRQTEVSGQPHPLCGVPASWE